MNPSRTQMPPRPPARPASPAAPAAPASSRPAAPAASPRPTAPARPALGAPPATSSAPAERKVDMSAFVDVTILGGFDAVEVRMKVADYDVLFVNLLAGEATLLHAGLGRGEQQHDFYAILQPGTCQIRRRSPNSGRHLPVVAVQSVRDVLTSIVEAQARAARKS